MRGIAYAFAERLEIRLGDRRLDQKKDLVLLELDTVCESRSEIMGQLERPLIAAVIAALSVAIGLISPRLRPTAQQINEAAAA